MTPHIHVTSDENRTIFDIHNFDATITGHMVGEPAEFFVVGGGDYPAPVHARFYLTRRQLKDLHDRLTNFLNGLQSSEKQNNESVVELVKAT